MNHLWFLLALSMSDFLFINLYIYTIFIIYIFCQLRFFKFEYKFNKVQIKMYVIFLFEKISQ